MQLMINKHGYILHKVAHKKGRKKIMTRTFIIKNHSFVTPKQVVNNVIDLEYLGVEKDYPE